MAMGLIAFARSSVVRSSVALAPLASLTFVGKSFVAKSFVGKSFVGKSFVGMSFGAMSVVTLSFVALSGAASAATTDLVALSGHVASAQEGSMEGVVVTAKKDGSTIAVSVVSNAQGAWSFPADRLSPGHYTITARAVGYDLQGPQAIDVSTGTPAELELKLAKTRNLSAQLNNAEWLLSIPGTHAQKEFLLGCVECHTAERIVKSSHDSAEFQQVFQRMGGYYPGSEPLLPQRLVGNAVRNVTHGASVQQTADWLASINLSAQQTWSYPLVTLPRLTGASTHVIITEYDLPSALIQPHDVVRGRDGMIWFSDFGEMQLGEMDPKTGKVSLYPLPVVKPGFPLGSLDLELDADGNPWIGMMYQATIAKFDLRTKTFKTWSVPKEWDSDAAQFGHLAVYGTPADGKVWIKNSSGSNIYRLDPATGQFENLGSFKDPKTGKTVGAYGVYSDSQNNLYLLDFSASGIGRIDAKTKAFTYFETPTLNSRPRRGRVDAQDRLWFAEFGGDAIGMFDPKLGRIQEWKIPTPWSAPYDAAAGTRGEAWSGSMLTDRVQRLDVASGKFTEYPLPHSTNIRRVFVDESQKQDTLWVGNDHAATIIEVEPTP